SFTEDASYQGTTHTDGFDILQENARVDYIGAQFVATSCQTCSTATVQLRTTILDISVPLTPADPLFDSNAGDIRYAKVKFVNRDNNSDISDWIPVTTLINTGDSKTGTVTYNMPVTLGTNEDARPITVGVL